ncbi:MAG TPA: hypothetical protein VH092_29620 [Urbifossiella sp.]|jgi:hypothetical protein|nr:hypothetical protein [Urbifossiella sp.]
MAVLAGSRGSFARTRQALRELCGWYLTHAAARRATTARDTRTDDERFAHVPGVAEVTVDVLRPAGQGEQALGRAGSG